MALTKPAGTWAYADLTALPDDQIRYEIIDGELFEMLSPTLAHARAIMALIRLLPPLLDRLGGTLLTAPLDVFFAGANPVQPDLVALLPDSRARGVRRGVEGPPDLLIEVLNPSKRAHDLVRKRQLYARGGVREYWIVDPEQRDRGHRWARGYRASPGRRERAWTAIPAVGGSGRFAGRRTSGRSRFSGM
ncbi:MAG: Uma2 family endonuclease [Thermomicrobiales bacterium]